MSHRGIRYVNCKCCGLEWNVSVFMEIPEHGFMCWKCRKNYGQPREEAGK